ncbi:hypothetical protein QNM97_07825 [Gordonia sp. L191]|uniref:hypothetical protein n=1 Tax=Gordonia TaxID=2053 RepID=UPI001FCC771D|nr:MULTISPECIES: hypothetical protein [Gordonia]WHU48878.1 hypothetical protein QNM97_07825 [Gordonia sp. L191]
MGFTEVVAVFALPARPFDAGLPSGFAVDERFAVVFAEEVLRAFFAGVSVDAGLIT